jgi:hypothetical protein
MKFFLLVSMCFFSMVILSECGHRQKGAGRKETSAASIPLPAAFVPPEDSSISSTRMAAWFGCNPVLDSLSDLFTKFLSPKNPVATDSAQKYFSYAQNRICVKNGLKGGYKEYRWILEHLGSTKNKAIYDSVRQMFQRK